MQALLITLHVFANLSWLGALAAVGLMLRSASRAPESEGAIIGRMARRIYGGLAQPAFGISFLFGVGMVSRDLHGYMHQHWFHGKLTLALAVIALHHVVGAKAKKVAGGSMQAGRNGAILTGALLLCALAAVTLVTFRQSLVP